MKSTKNLCYLLMSLLLSIEVYAQTRLRPIIQEEPSPINKLSEIPTPESDKKIKDSLEDLIQKAGWFTEIRVTVTNGVVLLNGKAQDADQLRWLASAADRLPSVIAVINKAEVATPSFTDFSPITDELYRLIKISKKALPSILIAISLVALFILIGRYLQKGLRLLWHHAISNPFLLATVTRITMIPIWVIFFYLILITIGLPRLATSILGGTGILGIVFGFAFKGIAENYLSGILLAARSPFTKGDLIQIEEYLGFVQSLNMRGTTIVDYDGNQILIPNTKVIQSVVKNYSANPITRTFFIVGIGYNESISQTQEIIISTLKEVKGIASGPAPKILVDSLGAATVNLKVFFWFDVKQMAELVAKSRAIVRVKEALLLHGITLPDEAREIVFADPLSVKIMDHKHETSVKAPAQKKVDSCISMNDEEEDTAGQLMGLAEKNSLPTNSKEDNLL